MQPLASQTTADQKHNQRTESYRHGDNQLLTAKATGDNGTPATEPATARHACPTNSHHGPRLWGSIQAFHFLAGKAECWDSCMRGGPWFLAEGTRGL